MTIIQRDFFARPTLIVARELLGQRLIRQVNGRCLSGFIVETEAYLGPDDTASHASKGRTPRAEIMFGPPAQTYVYLIYGMYYMLNFITERVDYPAAVLIRAIQPLTGIETMRLNRRRPEAASMTNLTNGPGKLCQALEIDRTLHNWDVTQGQQLWLEEAAPLPPTAIASGPRIGIGYAQARDRAAPWRFWLRENKFVSKYSKRI